ncbi:DNA internalization-related competence protein ComEC/Rec2 [Lujinxingia litoralis]|uniref:DNA internalization-related competence protein ComEC/Rec2 n=1 Tax=Lujinxingia litoralis TaxID=2211119 RepID=A0A328C2G3_9DELT|nr:DNA internalization-related competence protein ComEC/Rec2 [Lujinxingia litoralis]RAL20614.1 DNA internalization-related competence protein ComEC/Rec2 [Lujinxingia litoralis]
MRRLRAWIHTHTSLSAAAAAAAALMSAALLALDPTLGECLVLAALPAPGALAVAWLSPRIPWRLPLGVAAAAATLLCLSFAYQQAERAARAPARDWIGEERHELEVHLELTSGPLPQARGYTYDARLLGSDVDALNALLPARPPKVRLFYPHDHHPAGASLPRAGDRLRAWARLRRFAPGSRPGERPARQLMERRSYLASVTLREPPQLQEPQQPAPTLRLARALSDRRLALERRVATHLQGDALAVTWAMLTASRGLIRPEFRAPFDQTSTSHVLAISGLHFGVIAALITFALRLLLDPLARLYCWVPRQRLLVVPSLLCLLAYLVAIGAPISAQRAFLMVALASMTLLIARRLRPTSVLWTVAAALLIHSPHLLVEVGFQLSMAATAGILLFYQGRPAWLRPPQGPDAHQESRRSRRLRALGLFVGVSTAASVATLPPLIALSAELPVSGFWTNLIVIPLVGSLIFPLMVAGALLTSIYEPVAGVLLNLAGSLFLGLHHALHQVADWPLNELRLGTPSPLEWGAMWVACALAVAGGLRLRPCLIALLIWALGATPTWIHGHLVDSPTLKVHMIDVGQGDATLIEMPGGQTLLIDAGGSPHGPDPGLQRVAPYLRALGVRHLDALILTHADLDHYGGINALMRPFKPRIFIARQRPDHAPTHRLAHQAALQGAYLPRLPATLTISDGHATLTLLSPPDEMPSENDRSLVAILTYAGATLTLTGDLEEAGERWLLSRASELSLPSVVYKAGHHGSRTSSSPELLNLLQPRIALVSVGRPSPFGHPHTEVLERFQARNIQVFRTDHHGSTRLEVEHDGTLRIIPTRWPWDQR